MATTEQSVIETMGAIYPISALVKNQKAVKEAAQSGIVRITEQGVGAYVFSTEKEFVKAIERAKEEAIFEQKIKEAIENGRADKAAGRVRTDHEAFFDAARERLQ